MLRFIYRPKELAQCAQEIVSKSRKPLVAVAFWGAEIIEHLGLSLGNTTIKNSFDEVRIILNLAAGGTNASVVEQLRKAAKEFKKVGVNLTLRQSDKLHAKVWIGDNRVLVSSANASVNGLSFDSATQNCWNEAGLMVDDKTIVDEIRRWFERYWMDENQCRDISDTDLVRCPRRGPPAPPQNKPRSLSNILREDLCPIKLTILVGENTDAANKAASRQINKFDQSKDS
jgi:phosphatidylserine/phosphatidylglycerophosphate/cardiolipin synthase-like enzyme